MTGQIPYAKILESKQMLRVYQIARTINGRQELNTLDIKAYWELVEISAPEGDPEPEAWIEDGTVEEEDDWELVEISIPEGEPEPDV